ncbi:unnamed protein product [Schistosoma curassoni]|uniref:Uncharacterized protein n=1 Tax=Schistosoma curassoni TaxID=6186 RepID=A0A183JLC5_9TREM|nr:unnamed protein product [Schistosoma curassoni]
MTSVKLKKTPILDSLLVVIHLILKKLNGFVYFYGILSYVIATQASFTVTNTTLTIYTTIIITTTTNNNNNNNNSNSNNNNIHVLTSL